VNEEFGNKRPVMAVDLGGTKILAALFQTGDRVIDRKLESTRADEGVESVIRRFFHIVDGLLAKNGIAPEELGSISIAAAGGIDSRRGVITFSPNMPGWSGVPLRSMVEDRYRVSSFLLNDASAAALGEHRFGAGRGSQEMVLLTVGTGIGGGIITGGKLYLGADGAAGEIGHMTVEINGPECRCGNTGCLEMLASGTAMVREAVSRIEGGEASLLAEMAGNGGITGEMVSIAAERGDPLALEIIDRIAFYLGVGLVNLVNIFNPEIIVIGGGVANLGNLLLDPARMLVRERAFAVSAERVRIVTAELGNEAGIYGATAYASGSAMK